MKSIKTSLRTSFFQSRIEAAKLERVRRQRDLVTQDEELSVQEQQPSPETASLLARANAALSDGLRNNADFAAYLVRHTRRHYMTAAVNVNNTEERVHRLFPEHQIRQGVGLVRSLHESFRIAAFAFIEGGKTAREITHPSVDVRIMISNLTSAQTIMDACIEIFGLE